MYFRRKYLVSLKKNVMMADLLWSIWPLSLCAGYVKMRKKVFVSNVTGALPVCSSRNQEDFFMTDDKTYLDIPGEKSRELLARRQQFVARGVASTMSVFAAKAEGAVIEDVDGN